MSGHDEQHAVEAVRGLTTVGHFRRCRSKLNIPACRLRPESRHRITPSLSVAKGHFQTKAEKSCYSAARRGSISGTAAN